MEGGVTRMKIKQILLATGFVLSTSAVYYTGYQNGLVDKKDELQPKITKLQAEANESQILVEEVKHLGRKVDALNDKLSQRESQLATPVMLSTIPNASFTGDVNVASFEVSAYSPYDDQNYINSDGNPNDTATGTTPRPGTFAVDPDVIPYGSKMMIIYPDGTVETGIAEDTGGAIAGARGERRYRVDVFRYTYASAIAFGMRDAVVIWQ